MKKLIRLVLISVSFIALCACGTQYDNSESEGEEYYEPRLAYQDWEYPILEVEHGEDYVIEWFDKGMEAHVRLCLNKPEGDIYHSDVWNIRLFKISVGSGFDVFLEEPKDRDYFLVLEDSTNLKDIILYNEVMPDICSLQDLRHFDSLQIFSLDTETQSTALTDISGPEMCKNLQVFRLFGGNPDTLEPISKMTALERLSLSSFTNTVKLDLTPLQNLEHLSWLQIGETDILSLEPLCELDLLYLNLFCDYYNQEAHKDLDYNVLSKMDSLRFIYLTNNSCINYSDFKCVLSELKDLETIEISNVFTEEELAELRESFPNIRFICNEIN